MNIRFPAKCAYDPNINSIAFPAVVDGVDRRCLVTAEALMDHFGAPTMQPDHLREAFEANRDRIELAAQERIATVETGDIILRSRDF